MVYYQRFELACVNESCVLWPSYIYQSDDVMGIPGHELKFAKRSPEDGQVNSFISAVSVRFSSVPRKPLKGGHITVKAENEPS